MDNAGVFTLASLQITTPGATPNLLVQGPTNPDVSGMSSCNLVARFQYGTGGATFSAIAVTSFDGGTTWLHIARFDFATATLTEYANLSSGSKGITAYADLASAGVNDNLLGNLLAVKLVSTGTYVGTTLDLRAHCR